LALELGMVREFDDSDLGGATQMMSTITTSDLARQKPLESILEKEIKVRAYELYEQRGARDGRALEDWLKAEREVMSKTFAGSGSRIRDGRY